MNISYEEIKERYFWNRKLTSKSSYKHFRHRDVEWHQI